MNVQEKYREINALVEQARKEWEIAVCTKYRVPHWQHTLSSEWKGKDDVKIRKLHKRYVQLLKQSGEAFKVAWQASCLEYRATNA